MTNKAYAVPLHELLAGVPRDTRLEITDPDGYGTRFIPVGRYCHEAAEALRAALAQPEPVAVWELQEGGWDTIADRDWMESLPVGTKLYTAPPQREWIGLTDEEILADEVLRYHFALNGGAGPISKKGRAIIAAVNDNLREKNI